MFEQCWRRTLIGKFISLSRFTAGGKNARLKWKPAYSQFKWERLETADGWEKKSLAQTTTLKFMLFGFPQLRYRCLFRIDFIMFMVRNDNPTMNIGQFTHHWVLLRFPEFYRLITAQSVRLHSCGNIIPVCLWIVVLLLILKLSESASELFLLISEPCQQNNRQSDN